MEINWHPGARNDLQKLEQHIRTSLLSCVGDLADNPFGENTSLLHKQGLEIFRLKLKSDELDHRVFFDITDDGEEVLILGVMHRDNAYTSESLEKVSSRT